MVKCPRCGYENPSASLYCKNCDYLLNDPLKEDSNRKAGSWKMGLGKKIILVLGIIIIAFLLFSFVYNHSQSEKKDTLNIVGDNGSTYQSSTYPYSVNISYEGSWYAEMGDPNYLMKKSSSGNGHYVLDCASWDEISVSVQKQDYSDGVLNVQLIRNGRVVAENSTTDELGSVTLSYN